MTKICKAGHAQGSGNIKALISLSFQIAHSHSCTYHSTVSLFTLSSNNPHLPSGTFQLAPCLWVLCKMKLNGYLSAWFRVNRTFYPRKYRLQCGVKIMVGGELETKAVNYYG